MSGRGKTTIYARIGLGAFLLVALVAMLSVASPAQAGAPPDTCVEYPDDPSCEPPEPPPPFPPGDPSDPTDPDQLPGDGAGSVDPSQLGDGGGNLPFTGYPVSWLILFALLLLLLGLLVRAAIAARRRHAGDGPPSYSG
jgi:hypothetical protein